MNKAKEFPYIVIIPRGNGLYRFDSSKKLNNNIFLDKDFWWFNCNLTAEEIGQLLGGN